MFKQLNIHLGETEEINKNLILEDYLDEKSFVSSQTSHNQSNSVMLHLHKDEGKKNSHKITQIIAVSSIRTEKTPLRKTSSQKNNISKSKRDLKENIATNCINTPKNMEKKKTKRIIKPKNLSQDMTITEKILNKKMTLGSIKTRYTTNTNTRDKSNKKDKSEAIHNENDSFKTNNKSVACDGRFKKKASKSTIINYIRSCKNSWTA